MVTLDQVQQLDCFYQTEIEMSQIDVMGHLNVRHYVGIFDESTFAFFSAFGMDQAYYDSGNNGAFALEMHIRYLAEVRLGETVSVYSRFLGRTAKRIHFMHFMVNETRPNIAATLESVGSHANTAVRRTSPFPDHIARNIDQILVAHQKLTWDAPICGVMNP